MGPCVLLFQVSLLLEVFFRLVSGYADRLLGIGSFGFGEDAAVCVDVTLGGSAGVLWCKGQDQED